jgi:hypothetical protein
MEIVKSYLSSYLYSVPFDFEQMRSLISESNFKSIHIKNDNIVKAYDNLDVLISDLKEGLKDCIHVKVLKENIKFLGCNVFEANLESIQTFDEEGIVSNHLITDTVLIQLNDNLEITLIVHRYYPRLYDEAGFPE